MITLYRELKKFTKQIYGSGNIFGYKSTEANQLFALYCIFGKIYFTNKINPRVKYLWYLLNLCEISFFCVIGWIFFWHDTSNDLMLKLNVANAIGANFVEIFGFPLIVYLYGDEIDTMIKLVDDFVQTTTKKADGSHRLDQKIATIKSGTVFSSVLSPMILCFMVIYSFICYFDMVLLYDAKKVKNYLYYAYPTPLMQDYGTLRYFFIANSISTFFLEIYMFQLMSSLAIALQWNAICCNELIRVKNDFDSATRRLVEHIEHGTGDISWKQWNRDFQSITRRGTERFQKITLLINSLKGYVQVMGSFVVPTAFCYSVAVLYFSTAPALPFVLRIKFFVCYIGDNLLAFVFYHVGQNLDNTLSEVSQAIYSTPWYWSVKVRRDIHILLCQTQSVKNFAIIKVYGLMLKNFSRFLHAAFTYTNFLYKFTNK